MVVSVKAKSTRKMRLDRMAICFERLAANQPEPKTELDFSSPYTLLVAVVLSAQATDVGVNRATRGLFAAASTPAQMVALGVDGISHHIRTIGLFNTKARNVHRLSEILIADHDGTVPEDRAALEALPGLAGRQQMLCLMRLLAIQRLLSIRIFSGLETAPEWLLEKRLTM